jgi:hypothetical protein
MIVMTLLAMRLTGNSNNSSRISNSHPLESYRATPSTSVLYFSAMIYDGQRKEPSVLDIFQ